MKTAQHQVLIQRMNNRIIHELIMETHIQPIEKSVELMLGCLTERGEFNELRRI